DLADVVEDAADVGLPVRVAVLAASTRPFARDVACQLARVLLDVLGELAGVACDPSREVLGGATEALPALAERVLAARGRAHVDASSRCVCSVDARPSCPKQAAHRKTAG